MTFELPELPYTVGDLTPHPTTKTLEFHDDRHNRGYDGRLANENLEMCHPRVHS